MSRGEGDVDMVWEARNSEMKATHIDSTTRETDRTVTSSSSSREEGETATERSSMDWDRWRRVAFREENDDGE